MPIKLSDVAILDVQISPEGLLLLTMGGNLEADDHNDELVAWSDKTKEAILEIKRTHNGVVRSIVDISQIHKFDDGAIEIVRELAAWPDARDNKTAVIGGSMFSNMALRTIIYLSKRDNLKSFDTRAEALAWLGA